MICVPSSTRHLSVFALSDVSCDKEHNPDPVRFAAFITPYETRSSLLRRQNRLSAQIDWSNTVTNQILNCAEEYLGLWLRVAFMELIYRIVLWTVVFCHYTWSQEGKNILSSFHEPKRRSEVLRFVVYVVYKYIPCTLQAQLLKPTQIEHNQRSILQRNCG